MLLGSAESEHLRLTDHEIIFGEFQPMSSQSINVTDRQTDRGRTDGRTTCDRKIARALHCSASRGKNHNPYKEVVGVAAWLR